jgi:ABC-2 type transport system ATP-binding protein
MTSAADPVITVAGARKSFGETLVSRASTSRSRRERCSPGSGPNGCGKTTIVQILSTLIPANADELRVADHDVRSDPPVSRRSTTRRTCA